MLADRPWWMLAIAAVAVAMLHTGMVAHADAATLAETRASVITSGAIPDLYLIEPTGAYWSPKNMTVIYESLKTWTLSKDEAVPSELFQNKINRAMFNTLILLEGRADSPHYVTALVVSKERVQGTYGSDTPGYLKKYHDYIIGEYSIPGTASGIDAALRQALGDMLPLADEIASVMNRAASIGGVPTALLEEDMVYWVDVELTTNCKLDTGGTDTSCAPPPVISGEHLLPPATNQTVAGQSVEGASSDTEVEVYWRAVYCMSSYRGVSGSAVCSKTTTYDSLPGTRSVGDTVGGTKVYVRVSVDNESKSKIAASINVTPSKSGSGSDSTTSNKAKFSVDAWATHANTLKDHTCYAPYVGYDDYVDWPLVFYCLVSTTWSFSGTITAEAASTNGGGSGGGSTANVDPVITKDKKTDTGYVGYTYRHEVKATDANGDTLTYGISQFVRSNDATATISVRPDIDANILTWVIPDDDGYFGSYDVTVAVSDGRGGSDTHKFTLTVKRNNSPTLTVVGPENGTVIARHAGTLGDHILLDVIRVGETRYNLTGTDVDDQTLTLSVSKPPSSKAALTDCGVDKDDVVIYRTKNAVIDSAKTTSLTDSVCLVALDEVVRDTFEFELSDGLKSVFHKIGYSIFDIVSIPDKAFPLFETIKDGPRVRVGGVVSTFLNFGADGHIKVWRCDRNYYCPPEPLEPGVVAESGTTQRTGWILIANVTGTTNVTAYDYDIEPGRTYSYMARVFVGDKSSDYIPLGNVTTPADGPPVITLRGSSAMTILLGSPYVEPGYDALDDYDGDVTYDVSVVGTVDADREGQYRLFYYATDSTGNAATPQTRTVTVVDDSTPPVLTLKGPKAMSIDAGSTYAEPGYTATDNRDGNVTDAVVVTGTVDTAPGTYTIRYDVSDRVGNAAPTQNRTVTVVGDDVPPAITLKGPKTATIEAGSSYTDPGYTATDNRDGNVTDAVVVTGTVDAGAPGTYTIRYDVSDSSGNPAQTQTRTVTVVDTVPPTLTLAGGSRITVPASVPYVDPGYEAIDSIDGNITNRVNVAGRVNTDAQGSYLLQYTVYDSSGNTSPALTRTVIVADMTPPTLTLKGGSGITVSASVPYVDPGYMAIDNIDGNVTYSVVVTGHIDTDTLGIYTLHYDISDRARNAAPTQNRTVTVADMTPPVLTLKGGSSITVSASAPYVDPGYTATDNIDGNVTGSVVVTGHVDTGTPGTYTIHYDVWDMALNVASTQNRTVTVADMTPPVLTLKGGAEVQIAKGSAYADPGYTATDNIDGNVTGSVVVTGTVDAGTLGAYTISYEVTDGAGNTASATRTVTVVPDAVPPTITLKGGAALTMPMGPTFADPGYAAADNIDGNVTGMVSVAGTVDPLIPGTYTISYEVTDSSGNTERQTRTVTVSPPTDTTPYCDGMTLAQLMASGKYNIINKMFSAEPDIKGTNGADLIIAGGNGPTVEGRGGDDCIIGGAGDDTLLGMAGNDAIFGNGGDDTIRGGDDKDAIFGGAGDDTLHGGSGHDTIRGGADADEIHGGAGNDTIYGGSEDDEIWGLAGNDTIYGGPGRDTIYGGPGRDTIYGGPGTDTIHGGETDTVHDDSDDSEGG